MNNDIVIIGAGFAGIITAIRLQQLGYQSIIVDSSLPESQGEIGGFAKFSGAKFSLPPAGMGLLKITNSDTLLWETIKKVSEILTLDIDNSFSSFDKIKGLETIRQYDSIILSPHKMDKLLRELKQKLEKKSIKIINGYVSKIKLNNVHVLLNLKNNNLIKEIKCNTLFYAGGRMNSDILLDAGIIATNNKGIDIGARIEFMSGNGLSELRQYGPDAKLIKGNCRTFCLNVPGEIFRYQFKNISIPGGIISSSPANEKSNIGLLYRSNEKSKVTNRIIDKCKNISKKDLEFPYSAMGTVFGDARPLMSEIYGEIITEKLENFGKYISDKGLINLDAEHYVHLPLIDWHWNTFAINDSFRTSDKMIYCVGDSSGYARGLLQAAVSGWLAAESFANEN